MACGLVARGIVLHAFEGRVAFGPDSLRAIADLKQIYDLDLDARNSHRLADRDAGRKGA